MLLKKKKTFASSQASIDSGISSQPQSILPAFRNPFRHISRPPHRSPLNASRSPRSRPAPRRLASSAAVRRKESAKDLNEILSSDVPLEKADEIIGSSAEFSDFCERLEGFEDNSPVVKRALRPTVVSSEEEEEEEEEVSEKEREMRQKAHNLRKEVSKPKKQRKMMEEVEDMSFIDSVIQEVVEEKKKKKKEKKKKKAEEEGEEEREISRKANPRKKAKRRNRQEEEDEEEDEEEISRKAKPKKKEKRRNRQEEEDEEEISRRAKPKKKAKRMNRQEEEEEEEASSGDDMKQRAQKRRKSEEEGEEESKFKFRFFTTWVECVRCSKWRHLQDVFDPASLPEEWTCELNTDRALARQGCAALEEACDDVIKQKSLLMRFTEGSFVWARVPGYPFWPAMVDRDPDSDMCYYLSSDDAREKLPEPSHYHVTFLDNDVSRAWVHSRYLLPFTGVADMKKHSFKVRSRDFRSLVMATATSVEKAMQLDLKTRIRRFGFAFRWTGVGNQWATGDKKKKRRRKEKETRTRKARQPARNDELQRVGVETLELTSEANRLLDSIEQHVRASQS